MSGKGSKHRPILNQKRYDDKMGELYHIKINNKFYKKINLMDQWGDVTEKLVEINNNLFDKAINNGCYCYNETGDCKTCNVENE
jgi:hypothetical protein